MKPRKRRITASIPGNGLLVRSSNLLRLVCGVFAEHAVYGGTGGGVGSRQLPEALPALAILDDTVTIEIERPGPMWRPSRRARRMPARPAR
jgi:hypothetical protein